MAAGIDFDQEAADSRAHAHKVEFLRYCAELEEFSCRKRKKAGGIFRFSRRSCLQKQSCLRDRATSRKMRRRAGFDNMCCRKFERDGVNREASETLTCIADVQTSESG